MLASAGGLAIFNLAATDNARFASAKRAVKVYEGKVSLSGQALEQRGMAFQWYTSLVRLHVFAQVVALACMARATTATLVLQGATAFMGANVAFFLGGAGAAKHDENGYAGADQAGRPQVRARRRLRARRRRRRLARRRGHDGARGGVVPLRGRLPHRRR